jgi:hypothetical protein
MGNNAAASVGSEEELRLRLQGLQHEVEKSAGRVRRLAFMAILLVIALILLLISLHLYNVLQYASVDRVQAGVVEGMPGTAQIRYTAKTAGKIEFVRESEGLVQTLTEYADPPTGGDAAEAKFQWSGKQGERSTIRVTYRDGLFLTTKDLSPKAAPGER